MKLDALQSVILAVAQARSSQTVLDLIVRGLSELPGVALARIWLLAPGDICSTCFFQKECPDQTVCLHLEASAGKPIQGDEDWSRLDGDFRRFPLGVRKVGKIGAGEPSVLLRKISQEPEWIARPDWARQQRIRSFAGHPLIFRQQVLGVLAVFSRNEFSDQEFAWLKTFADHAAVAIANARAIEEIDVLRQQLERENTYLREEVRLNFGTIVGDSAVLHKMLHQIKLVAPTDASVLITGETGTGKELVARAIHEQSSRTSHPIVRVNCGSIPRELFESEFFGHVKGAFTGALRDRTGRFELAEGGTLFLDEVGEIPPELQSKLLRVLQEGEYERVGEGKVRKANVRIIAATNRDLEKEVDGGRFRRDLFFRLSVFPILVPSLRQRVEDIPLLANHFLEVACKRLSRRMPRLTQQQLRQLQQYEWPGNIRELQNVIERAVILSDSGKLRLESAFQPSAFERLLPQQSSSTSAFLTEAQFNQRERHNVLAALQRSGGKVYGPSGAAALLGLNATTLAYRIKKWGINPKQK